jgi:hypothetical protein
MPVSQDFRPQEIRAPLKRGAIFLGISIPEGEYPRNIAPQRGEYPRNIAPFRIFAPHIYAMWFIQIIS